MLPLIHLNFLKCFVRFSSLNGEDAAESHAPPSAQGKCIDSAPKSQELLDSGDLEYSSLGPLQCCQSGVSRPYFYDHWLGSAEALVGSSVTLFGRGRGQTLGSRCETWVIQFDTVCQRRACLTEYRNSRSCLCFFFKG